MSMQRRISRAGGTRVKRALGVQAALEWAFRVEKAQLELPERPDPERGSGTGTGFGLEHVLLQRAALGCKVDGGQYKMGGYTHADAEVIAATVAGMPDSLGGKRMAIRVVELARAGLNRHGSARGRLRPHSLDWRDRPLGPDRCVDPFGNGSLLRPTREQGGGGRGQLSTFISKMVA